MLLSYHPYLQHLDIVFHGVWFAVVDPGSMVKGFFPSRHDAYGKFRDTFARHEIGCRFGRVDDAVVGRD
jgi:hypothetical protein